MSITYEDLSDRLTPEARELFAEMVAAHLEAGSGDRLFIRCDTMDGTGLIFTGGSGSRRSWDGFDGGAIEDLVSYGLLHLGFARSGTPNYRITGDALHFHRWLMEQAGSPLDQLEAAIHHSLDSDGFARAHAGCAHHLNEAFGLLWSGREGDQVVSEIGDHLRKALMDVVADVIGIASDGQKERPIQALEAWLQSSAVRVREAAVLGALVEFARVSLRLDHRLNHVRDEADKGEAASSWDEVRRAAFATALVCYELDRAVRRR
jgi:hypothetical protein